MWLTVTEPCFAEHVSTRGYHHEGGPAWPGRVAGAGGVVEWHDCRVLPRVNNIQLRRTAPEAPRPLFVRSVARHSALDVHGCDAPGTD